MNIGTAHGSFASRSILGDIFSDLGVFQQPAKTSDKDDAGTLDLITGKLMIGYGRVSTADQDLTAQRSELKDAGCTKIFAEKITGTRRNRPELERMLDHLRPGDVVTVTRRRAKRRGFYFRDPGNFATSEDVTFSSSSFSR